MELFESAGRVLLGNGVNERTEGAGQIGLGFRAGGGNQPVQWGAVDGFQARGRKRNRAAARVFGRVFSLFFAVFTAVFVQLSVICRAVRKEQLRARKRQQTPPLVGSGAGRLSVRQARQSAGGGVESVRGSLRGERLFLRCVVHLRAVLLCVLLLGVFGTHRVHRFLNEGAAKLRHEGTQGRGAAHAGDGHVRGVADRVGG